MKIYIILKNKQELCTEIESPDILKKMVKRANDGKMIVIGGSAHNGFEIAHILNEENYQRHKQHEQSIIDQRKEVSMSYSGMWKCAYGYWHNKNTQCGHDLVHGGKISTEVDYLNSTGTSIQSIIEERKKLK